MFYFKITHMAAIVVNLFVVFVLLILIQRAYKSLKKIWQKISIVYNQIYEKLIVCFYDTQVKKNLLKEELVDFYKDVIKQSDCLSQYKVFGNIRWFVEALLWDNIKDNLSLLDGLYEYYNSIVKWLYILLFVLIMLIWLLIIFVILTY